MEIKWPGFNRGFRKVTLLHKHRFYAPNYTRVMTTLAEISFSLMNFFCCLSCFVLDQDVDFSTAEHVLQSGQ